MNSTLSQSQLKRARWAGLWCEIQMAWTATSLWATGFFLMAHQSETVQICRAVVLRRGKLRKVCWEHKKQNLYFLSDTKVMHGRKAFLNSYPKCWAHGRVVQDTRGVACWPTLRIWTSVPCFSLQRHHPSLWPCRPRAMPPASVRQGIMNQYELIDTANMRSTLGSFEHIWTPSWGDS